MQLEVLTHRPKTVPRSTPLLFVHGMYCSASIWQNFLPFFADHGYESHALSLRGHGGSEGRERLSRFRAFEYVDDVASVADSLRSTPVLIGHSLGGYIVQKYLETRRAPAAVLLASVPPGGMLPTLARLAVRQPWQSLKCHLLRSPIKMIETQDLFHDLFFSADMPAETVRQFYGLIQQESYCAAADATFVDLPRPRKVRPTPMLVLSGDREVLHTREQVESTARAYGADLGFIPNLAHVMMLEAGWRKAAEHVLAWLGAKGL